jgi:hypothetical protein
MSGYMEKGFFLKLICLSNFQVLSMLYGVLISGENVGQDAAGGPFLLDFQVQNWKPSLQNMYLTETVFKEKEKHGVYGTLCRSCDFIL